MAFSDRVHARVSELVDMHPMLFKLQTVTKAIAGYSASLQVVTVELGDRSVPAKDKLRMMLVGAPRRPPAAWGPLVLGVSCTRLERKVGVQAVRIRTADGQAARGLGSKEHRSGSGESSRGG